MSLKSRPQGGTKRKTSSIQPLFSARLCRLSRATQETPITFHSLPGPEPETKPASRPHSERRSTLVIRSALNHTLPDFNAGLAVSQRILLHLGGKLTITTEDSAGSNLEVELPA